MPFIDAVATFFRSAIYPIQWLVAWIMVTFHDLWTALGPDPAGGPAWALSIAGLVVVVRIALVPLFVKQVKAMRGMQALQPEIRKIQAKYKGKTDPASRQAMQQEQFALMRTSGANPMGSCLPVLLQAPVLYALFATLNGVRQHEAIGPLSDALVRQADAAALFSAPLSGILWGSQHAPTIIAATAMIVLMSASQFATQKLVSVKNTAIVPAEGGVLASQQKVLLYVLPLMIAVPGLHFPIGVLLYWLTSNLWSIGQQAVAIRLMPNPGSLAEKELAERRARRATRRAGTPTGVVTSDTSEATTTVTPRQRDQPRTPGSRSVRRRPTNRRGH